jgi:hypothetical protein
MPKARTSRSKRARFAIFERDLFTCQYCGLRPPDAVLQLDHIHPLSKGGEDTEENLTTSCVDCNAGKSDRVLGAVTVRPDANMQLLAVQQEISEARIYLESKKVLDDLYKEIADNVLAYWTEHARIYYDAPQTSTILRWIREYGVDEVEGAIQKAAWRDSKRYFDGRDGFARYVSGILKRRKEEAAE